MVKHPVYFDIEKNRFYYIDHECEKSRRRYIQIEQPVIQAPSPSRANQMNKQETQPIEPL